MNREELAKQVGPYIDLGLDYPTKPMTRDELIFLFQGFIENILTGMHDICGRWDNDTDTCLVLYPQNCPGWFLCKSKDGNNE